MEEKPVVDLLTTLARQNIYNIHSLLVVKDGKLVLETYYPGDDISLSDTALFTRKDFDRDTPHCLASATKSVTSILFGIALDQGKITGVDEKMFASFPEYAELSDGGKEEITLRQMLTMSSGIPWDESYPYTDARNDLGNMLLFSPDPVRYVLAKQLTHQPGEMFVYNSGTTNLLGEIVRRKTGTALAEYARDNLFAPLGITSSEWPSFPKSPQMAVASSLLYLKPRDMAKIGQLYLQQGSWNGKQIVSSRWVKESTAISVVPQPPWDFGPSFENTGYGYLWWRGKFANGDTDTAFAAGWGGQFIFIMPKINTVVVTTGENYTNGYSDVFNMINRYILGSVYGDL
jgi:CubicO group peptidase (beta-lactamase class C family)